MRRFELQQACFDVDSAREADEFARRADDAMARHHDRDRIAAVGRSDRARLPQVAQLLREIAVRARLAVRDREQRVPNRLLERSAREVEVERKRAALAREVFVELSARSHEDRRRCVLPHLAEHHARRIVVLPQNRREPVIASDEHERADGRWVAAER